MKCKHKRYLSRSRKSQAGLTVMETMIALAMLLDGATAGVAFLRSNPGYHGIPGYHGPGGHRARRMH